MIFQRGKRFLERLMKIRVSEDIELPCQSIAKDFMDKGVVYLDYFLKPMRGGTEYIIYSVGIGDQINFELDILNRLKDKNVPVQLYAFDPTPKSLEFLAKQNLPDNFHVYPYAIVDCDKKLEFALPQADGWISGSAEEVYPDSRNLDIDNKIVVQGRSIESIMKELGHSRVDLLKMDIEGSEFTALDAMLEAECDVMQMSIDHHEYMLKHGNKRLKKLLCSLKENGYKIFYASREDMDNRNFSCIKSEVK